MNAFRFRPAQREDAPFLVPLIAESSGGVWPAVWKALARENETIEESGAKYIADSCHDLSIRNTILVERKDQRIGALTCYQEKRPVKEAHGHQNQPELPAKLALALQPYRELSDPESLFIAEICLLPASRGMGLGTRLLENAMDSAASLKLPRITLRVFSSNHQAVRLYERMGFNIVGERPVVPHPDIKATGSVYLMSYSL